MYRVSHNIGPTLYFVIFLDSRAQTAQTDYNDIFGDNPQEIAKIGRQLKTKHEKLKKIVNNKPDAPAASAAASTIISDDNSQCSADDCVSIFLGAAACTARGLNFS